MSATSPSDAEFDYVIVGGGSAGCVLANRLSASGEHRVCLVEAGPPDDSPLLRIPAALAVLVRGTRYNWQFQTVPQPGLDGRCGFQPRGRTLGGCSAINAMIYIRGHPNDYDRWADAGNPGWAWSDVLPYFLRAEDNLEFAGPWHARGGPLSVASLRSPSPWSHRFVEAARNCGIPANADFNGSQQLGAGLYQVTQAAGRRCSAATAYLRPVRHRPSLTVLTDAHASRLLSHGRRVYGVEVFKDNTRHRLTARREVILCAGAFGSPQLLLLSGIGPGPQLQALGIEVTADLPGVGQHLQDHIDYTLNWRRRAAGLHGLAVGTVLRMPGELWRYLRHGDGLLASNFAEAGAFLRCSAGAGPPDLQLHFAPALIVDHNRRPVFGQGFSIHVCVLQPASRGEVRLASPDPRAAPVIDPRFLDDERDLAMLVAGFRVARRIGATPPLAATARESLHGLDNLDTDDAIAAELRRRADTLYHPVGTCRMGSGADAVVDAQLKVHGLAGLRVADASIMPNLIRGNTNAPTLMIAEKAAALILAN